MTHVFKMPTEAAYASYKSEEFLPAWDILYRSVSKRFMTSNTFEFCISPIKETLYSNQWYCSIMSHVHAVLQFATDWILIPEFTDGDRLHWHGYLKVSKGANSLDQIRCHTDILAKLTKSRVSVSKIRNAKAYIEYVFKNYLITLKHHSLTQTSNRIEEQHGQPMHYNFFKDEELVESFYALVEKLHISDTSSLKDNIID